MHIFKVHLLIITSIILTGCASIPEVIQGEFSTLTPVSSKVSYTLNQNVRWSGYIVQTINKKDKTCFEVVETETYKDLRPKRVIPKNGGRFIACKDGFLESTAFDKRLVTITGSLVAYTEKNIGEYNYEYPVIKTDRIYIWRPNPRLSSHVGINHSLFFHHRITHFSCRHTSMNGYCYP
jgi:outer membrane lipoprotein